MNTKVFKIRRTHIAEVRETNTSQMGEVCDLLGWTIDQYTDYQFYQYQMFVWELCKGWPMVRKEIEYSPVFRGFWNNEWSHRNQHEFLPFAYDIKYDKWQMLEEYRLLNDHEALLNDDAFLIRYEHVRRLI
ncbi:hypothetical protein [Mucilaginibacter sp.]|uniref:hypothetical protein n=1 Tax=Mucilaginibacter sp. TaxID=1882438 RepID=UPI0032668158